MSYAEVGAALGVCGDSIKNALLRRGISTPRKRVEQAKAVFDKEKAATLRKSGMSWTKISAIVGGSTRQVEHVHSKWSLLHPELR